ncbi:MAG: GNAT family N-acetyltransferase [Hyphomicrobiaceae bacterium]
MMSVMLAGLTIRTYVPRDESALLALVRELQAHEGHLYDRMKPVEAIGTWYVAELEKQCAESSGHILVAESEGAIVAYATILCRVEDDSIDEVPFTYAYVGDLAVTRACRGQGIGKVMLAECERIAREAGARWLRITVLARNGEARAAYRSFGFAEQFIGLEKPIG